MSSRRWPREENANISHVLSKRSSISPAIIDSIVVAKKKSEPAILPLSHAVLGTHTLTSHTDTGKGNLFKSSRAVVSKQKSRNIRFRRSLRHLQRLNITHVLRFKLIARYTLIQFILYSRKTDCERFFSHIHERETKHISAKHADNQSYFIFETLRRYKNSVYSISSSGSKDHQQVKFVCLVLNTLYTHTRKHMYTHTHIFTYTYHRYARARRRTHCNRA